MNTNPMTPPSAGGVAGVLEAMEDAAHALNSHPHARERDALLGAIRTVEGMALALEKAESLIRGSDAEFYAIDATAKVGLGELLRLNLAAFGSAAPAGDGEMQYVGIVVEAPNGGLAISTPAAPAGDGTPSSRWAANGEPDPHGHRYDCQRAELAMGDLTDDDLANAVFLHGNERPSFADIAAGKALPAIAYLTAAKDRIRWLSRRLAEATAPKEQPAAPAGGGGELREYEEGVRRDVIPRIAEQQRRKARGAARLLAGTPECENCERLEVALASQIEITNTERALAEQLAARLASGGSAPSGDGVSLIAAERQRQVEAEGWAPEHDDEHDGGELAQAAACYAAPPLSSLREHQPPMLWPWDECWWKPGDRVRELVKAGALIAAEIDRLQRADAPLAAFGSAAPAGDGEMQCVGIVVEAPNGGLAISTPATPAGGGASGADEGDIEAIAAEVELLFANPGNDGGDARRLADRIRRLASAGSAPAPSGWRPIETAPKSAADGSAVAGVYLLGFCFDPDLDFDPQACIDIVWWEPLLPNRAGGRGKWCRNNAGEAIEVSPTHWQPLPAAPTQEPSHAD